MANKASKKVSVKHLQMDKSQSTILAIVVLTTVIAVFGLFATKALVTKGLYQRRALHARREVASQLESNYNSAKTLFTQYTVFVGQDPNVLGGTIVGTGNLDGDNARITLDSLPSKYDAPALASSVEKMLTNRNATIESIKVTDDPTANSDIAQATPAPKAVTFSFHGSTTFANGFQLMQDFEKSIRVFDTNTLVIEGSDNDLKLTVGMTTYFQPAKSLVLTPTKEVK